MMLYELTNEYITFLLAIEEGTIPEEAIADTLESIQEDIKTKADSIACLLKNLEAEAAAIKAEESRLAERRKAKENQRERIKEYLSAALKNAGIDKLETTRNRISFRKSENVEVDDDFIAWAKEYRDDLLVFAEPKANLTEIKRAIKAGNEVQGAYIRVNTNLQLK